MPTGGRGKAGGIKSVKDVKEADENLSQILGMDIKGFKVNKVLAEEKVDINKE
ncbi:MAG: ATP-grasp domain-containing protein, partial [Candidatus Heimdallarchaeota archaeon]